MDTPRFQPGMTVDCLGTRLGTVSAVRPGPAGQVLEVQVDRESRGSTPLLIPVTYVAQVLDRTILLSVSCEEAQQIALAGRGTAATPTAGPAAPSVTRPIQTMRAESGATALSGNVREIESGSVTVPIVEEQLVTNRRWQEAGAVELRKTVRTVNQELDVPVRYEEATLERVPVNRVLAEEETPSVRQDGETLIVPVIHEELVVMKRRVLVEEIHVRRQVQTTTRHISEPVRQEEVQITHQGLDAHPFDPAAGSATTTTDPAL